MPRLLGGPDVRNPETKQNALWSEPGLHTAMRGGIFSMAHKCPQDGGHGGLEAHGLRLAHSLQMPRSQRRMNSAMCSVSGVAVSASILASASSRYSPERYSVR